MKVNRIEATLRDSTQLIFLRARWYNPADGRFQSRDTWEGDVNRPLSMNRWMYVVGNPVNLTDPTGKFPIQCQSMPTKGAYAACVLNFYDLAPYDEHDLGLSVEGSQGCYSGPDKYRAPGYIEGIGGQIGPIVGNVEFVYDFATMQGADFWGHGGGGSWSYPIFADSVYIGFMNGLKHSDDRPQIDIYDNYEGPSFFITIGINDMVPVALNAGAVRFTSIYDPRIAGIDFYFGASVGIPGLESIPIDFMLGVIYAKRLSGITMNYIMQNGRVNGAKLYSDIQTGVNSPLMGLAKYSSLRQSAVLMAMKYVLAYESLHEKQWLGIHTMQ